jgi:hypothetical protein
MKKFVIMMLMFGIGFMSCGGNGKSDNASVRTPAGSTGKGNNSKKKDAPAPAFVAPVFANTGEEYMFGISIIGDNNDDKKLWFFYKGVSLYVGPMNGTGGTSNPKTTVISSESYHAIAHVCPVFNGAYKSEIEMSELSLYVKKVDNDSILLANNNEGTDNIKVSNGKYFKVKNKALDIVS